jgi:hypothetical protein
LRRPPLLQRGGGVGRYHYGSKTHANPMILYARLASTRRTPARVRTWRILVGAAVQLGPWSPLSCTEYGCGDGRNGADYQLCWARSACWTSPSRAFRQAPEGWRQAELAAHVRRTRSAPLGKPDSRELKARSAASPEGEPLAPPQSMQVWIQRVRIQRLMSLDPEGPRQAQVGPEGLAQA